MSILKIGITGNIGAGKSLVCSIFEILDIPVYYADARAKQLMTQDTILVDEIKSLFGERAYTTKVELNREYIGGIVFKNKAKLAKLNALVHPAVGRDFEKWVLDQNAPYVLKEAALLFEAGSYRDLDKTVLVIADEDKRLKRVMLRDNVDRPAVRKRMNNQMPQKEKQKMADYIIDNNGSLSLVKQVLALHTQFLDLNSTVLHI